VLGVPLAAGSGRITPELRCGVGQLVGDRSKRPSAAVAAIDEVELSWMEDRRSDT
jgi:hypothetical protein